MTAQEFLDKVRDKNVPDKQIVDDFFDIEYPEDADLDQVIAEMEEVAEVLQQERPYLNI